MAYTLMKQKIMDIKKDDIIKSIKLSKKIIELRDRFDFLQSF